MIITTTNVIIVAAAGLRPAGTCPSLPQSCHHPACYRSFHPLMSWYWSLPPWLVLVSLLPAMITAWRITVAAIAVAPAETREPTPGRRSCNNDWAWAAAAVCSWVGQNRFSPSQTVDRRTQAHYHHLRLPVTIFSSCSSLPCYSDSWTLALQTTGSAAERCCLCAVQSR